MTYNSVDQFSTDEYYEEAEESCRRCGQDAVAENEVDFCEFCSCEIPTGRVHYRCDCGKTWIIGRRNYGRNRCVACIRCRNSTVGNCHCCGESTTGADANVVNGNLICGTCYQKEEPIWCPVCEETFPQSGYLRFVFATDPPALHAAALVTHYRHEHIVSHDRAWQSRRYSSRIPGYDYDLSKEKINNRAKRQLIRAVTKQLKAGSYSESAPIAALDLIRAFSRLRYNDDATTALIRETEEKFGETGPSRPDPIADCLLQLAQQEWIGTSTHLVDEVRKYAESIQAGRTDMERLPKSAQGMVHAVKRLQPWMDREGIVIDKRKGKGWEITIRK